MKHVIILFLISTCFFSCVKKKRALKGETEFQKNMNADFKDASKSPLKEKDRKHFEGLNFFDFDSAYIVKAFLKRTPNTDWFSMKTTTDRVSEERIYGVLTFELKGTTFNLNVYQGKALMQEEGFENYLFLPFLDKTNGFETYGGGRYIDAEIVTGNVMFIDFNKAYNPYCAYNPKYSCPIVPRVNFLNVRVEAGVKNFDK